ncbi:unnamed protein product [Protopolystoma xenopodis]|uniref:Uncharacterized protein n=1 Tax=Protopolystoma xenopodis TaxID=117903 RepID=A0A448WIQ2_9PLAT|nr:unnamed protein product [Protopolystoma xenopodis]
MVPLLVLAFVLDLTQDFAFVLALALVLFLTLFVFVFTLASSFHHIFPFLPPPPHRSLFRYHSHSHSRSHLHSRLRLAFTLHLHLTLAIVLILAYANVWVPAFFLHPLLFPHFRSRLLPTPNPHYGSLSLPLIPPLVLVSILDYLQFTSPSISILAGALFFCISPSLSRFAVAFA